MKSVLLGFSVLAVCAMHAPKVYACSCVSPGTPTEEFARADLVFAGEVVGIDSVTIEIYGTTVAMVNVSFRIERFWKSSDSTQVAVLTAPSTASCGYPFLMDVAYLVYAYQGYPDDAFATGLCTRTKPLSAADEDIAALDRVVPVEEAAVPSAFELAQNYPNPFNPSTRIAYALEQPAFVALHVYDLQGRRVQTLVNSFKSNGEHGVMFEAGALPSGVYLYELIVGQGLERKLMMRAR